MRPDLRKLRRMNWLPPKWAQPRLGVPSASPPGAHRSPPDEHQLQRTHGRRRLGVGILVGLATSALVTGSSVSVASTAPEPILVSSSDGSGSRVEVGVKRDWLGSPSTTTPDAAGQDRVTFPSVTLPATPTANVPVSEVTDLGIPQVALNAYRSAAASMAEADPGCRIDWSLIAGIGKVETSHGQYGGRQPATDGTVAPPIIGIALDGRPGVALIRDTDRGRLDSDTTYDRAVGPMQFIPGTWSRFPDADGDGNGVADPHNLYDAALATATYLCSGPGNLAEAASQRAAVLRYNHSESYVDLVLTYAQAYAAGVRPSDPPPKPAGAPPAVPDVPVTSPAHPEAPVPGAPSSPPTTEPPPATSEPPPATTEPPPATAEPPPATAEPPPATAEPAPEPPGTGETSTPSP